MSNKLDLFKKRIAIQSYILTHKIKIWFSADIVRTSGNSYFRKVSQSSSQKKLVNPTQFSS